MEPKEYEEEAQEALPIPEELVWFGARNPFGASPFEEFALRGQSDGPLYGDEVVAAVEVVKAQQEVEEAAELAAELEQAIRTLVALFQEAEAPAPAPKATPANPGGYM